MIIGNILYHDIVKWCLNKYNHKWVVLILFFFIGDLITTYIGLHYELMDECNPIITSLITTTGSLGIALLIVAYGKYVLLTVMYVLCNRFNHYLKYVFFYTIYSLSIFIVVNNSAIIIFRLVEIL